MPKVTSKLQLTVPKAIADQYSIRPGDNLEWIPAGDSIRVIPSNSRRKGGHPRTVEERLELFDQATRRQRAREASPPPAKASAEEALKPHEAERGWRREDLYTRGRHR
jgi:bifunctional DNA-binding transcriptional regulator/antitoxin component of YhaV-PrlF toxin-antitoxin module